MAINRITLNNPPARKRYLLHPKPAAIDGLTKKSPAASPLLNPKAILFYLSFFVQFVDPDYPYPVITFTALALVLQIISMSYLTVLIFSGAKLATYFTHRYKVTATCVAAVGVLFCGFGLKLATSTL